MPLIIEPCPLISFFGISNIYCNPITTGLALRIELTNILEYCYAISEFFCPYKKKFCCIELIYC